MRDTILAPGEVLIKTRIRIEGEYNNVTYFNQIKFNRLLQPSEKEKLQDTTPAIRNAGFPEKGLLRGLLVRVY